MVKTSSAYTKDIRRTIIKGRRRFFSIMIITTLGVMMFSGLKAACQDLRYSADSFFDSQHLHDLSAVSTLGFEEEDIEALRQVPSVEDAVGIYSEELMTQCAGVRQKTSLTTVPDGGIDMPYLIRGTMPSKKNEAAATQKYLHDTGSDIGDVIVIEQDDETETSFTEREYTITAEVTDPCNVNNPFGSVSYRDAANTSDTVFVLPSSADTDIYTAVYLTVCGTREMFCFSDEYENAVREVRSYIERYIKTAREKARTESIKNDALEELEKKEKDVLDELADAKKKLDDAEKEWRQGKDELDRNSAELDRGRKEAQDLLAAAQRTIDEARALLEEEKRKFELTRADLLRQIEELEQNERDLLAAKDGLMQIDDGIRQIDEGLAQLEADEVKMFIELLKTLPEDTELEELFTMMDQAKELIDQLEESGFDIETAAEAAAAISEQVQQVETDHETLHSEETLELAEALKLLDGQLPLDSEEAAETGDISALKETVLRYVLTEEIETVQDLLNAYEQACLIADPVYEMLQSEEAQEAMVWIEALDPEQNLLDLADEEMEKLHTMPSQLAEIAGQEAPETVGELIDVYEKAVEKLEAQKQELIDTRKTITDGLAENGISEDGIDAAVEMIRDGIRQIREGIAYGEQQLLDAEAQLDEGQRQLDENRIKTLAQLDDLLAQIADAYRRLNEGRKDIDEGWEEYREGEKEAKEEFEKARKTIADIDTAEWFLLDRMEMSGYANIDSDAGAIEAIGTVFPIVFFVVAILISLTAITRMVEEERGLIGTYKSLGYTDLEISRKYLVYAAGACIAGSLLGTVMAFAALPAFIFMIFSIMYLLPEYHLTFVPLYGLLGPFVFLGGILAAVAAAANGQLKQVPAALMRPLAPKAGSKVFLEHISPLWKRMSFLNKVTARNLFRYRKRMLMTVSGVAGCVALLLFGFAIGDSVHDLPLRQYEETFGYDVLAAVQGSDFSRLKDTVMNDPATGECIPFMITSVRISYNGSRQEAMQIFVFEDNTDLSGFISLRTAEGEPVSCDDTELLITRNAGSVFGFDSGDTIRLQLMDLQTADIPVGGLVDNYLGNYVYMSRSAYERWFEDYAENGLLIRFRDDSADSAAYTEKLKGMKNIMTVLSTDEMKESFAGAFRLINAVVWIIIVMSAALAFVVLFTLSSINISERTREIATVKVLGFFDHEVHVYIDKETVILTLLGILLGIPLGWAFAQTLTSILNLPSIYLAVSLHLSSYCIAAGLSVAFALAVNVFADRILDSIDPAEALKSIE